jgi:thymidine kinase
MSVDLILGCMFSGKTTELIRRVYQYRNAGMCCLVLNSIKDTRCSKDEIKTHNGTVLECLKVSSLSDINVDAYDVIAVDEGQFFKDLLYFVCFWADAKNKKVIVAGLNGDCERSPWQNINEIIPHATSIEFKKASCHLCRELDSAIYSMRIIYGEKKREDGCIIDVGGADKYVPACRTCYNNELKRKV